MVNSRVSILKKCNGPSYSTDEKGGSLQDRR